MKIEDLKRIELDLAVNDKGGFFLAKEIPFITIKNIFNFIKSGEYDITDCIYSKELLIKYNKDFYQDKHSDEKYTSFFGNKYNYFNYRKVVDKVRGKHDIEIEKSFKDDFNKLLVGELGFIEFSKRNIVEFENSEFSIIDIILMIFILKEGGLIINPENSKNHIKLSIDINDTLNGFFLNKKIPISEIRKVFLSVLNISIDDFIYNEEKLDKDKLFGNESPADLLKNIYISEELFE